MAKTVMIPNLDIPTTNNHKILFEYEKDILYNNGIGIIAFYLL